MLILGLLCVKETELVAEKAYEMAINEEMKRHPNYKTGENYAYLGLPPCFLIFDEYVAFFEMLGTKESVSLLSQLKKSLC